MANGKDKTIHCVTLYHLCKAYGRELNVSAYVCVVVDVRFIMVSVRKGEIPVQDQARFQPDGTYVPRILFFTPDGEFMKDIYNCHPKADDKYKYFYSNTSQIISSMILALERYSEESLKGALDDKIKKK